MTEREGRTQQAVRNGHHHPGDSEGRTDHAVRGDCTAAPEQTAGTRRHQDADSDAAGSRSLRHRIETDRESVQRDLARLVLTVVELLRELMERQAIRRVDEGDLSDEQVEEVGQSLMHLEEALAELREHFGLDPSDLNIDLGPLGPLLPD